MNDGLKHTKLAIIDPVGSKAGMDRYDFRLAAALRRLDVPVLVLTDSGDPDITAPVFFRFTLRKNIFSLLLTLWSLLKALRYCRKSKVTHVLVHIYAFSAFDEWMLRRIRAFGFRTLTLVHDVEPFVQAADPSRRRRIVVELSDHLLVHTASAAEELKAVTGRTEGISVLPHGHFIGDGSGIPEKADARRSLGIPVNAYCPLFFGMIKPTKGLMLLCKAVEAMPSDVLLLVAGRPRGRVSQELQRLERLQHAGRVLAKTAYLPENEMELWMAAADCVVLPYERSYQSGVAIQAMSRDVPVVLSDLPVHREWVRSGASAQLFRSGDADSLTEAILRLKNNDGEAHDMALAAKRFLLREHAWELPAGIIRNLLLHS